MMLKLNGADNTRILYVLMANASIQCVTAWFCNTLLLYLFSLIAHESVFIYIKLGTGFIIGVYLINLILLYKFVKKISVEKILRS